MAAKSEQKPFEMVQCDDISNWLEDIFDAADEGIITSPETPVLQETMAALDVKGSGAERAPGSEKQRGWGEEDDGRNSYKKKKSRREKLRREALNDQFMLLSALLDPNEAGPLTTDRATIVTKAAVVIKRLREELSATLETLQNAIATVQKETSVLAGLAADKAALQQEKAELERQSHCFMSIMAFASPLPGAAFAAMPMSFQPSGAARNGDAVKLAPKQPEGWVMPDISSLPRLLPRLVVQTTSAEEDTQLHAPCA